MVRSSRRWIGVIVGMISISLVACRSVQPVSKLEDNNGPLQLDRPWIEEVQKWLSDESTRNTSFIEALASPNQIESIRPEVIKFLENLDEQLWSRSQEIAFFEKYSLASTKPNPVMVSHESLKEEADKFSTAGQNVHSIILPAFLPSRDRPSRERPANPNVLRLHLVNLGKSLNELHADLSGWLSAVGGEASACVPAEADTYCSKEMVPQKVWKIGIAGEQVTWLDAAARCNAMNTEGRPSNLGGWHLPSMSELEGAAQYLARDPLSKFVPGNYWTSNLSLGSITVSGFGFSTWKATALQIDANGASTASILFPGTQGPGISNATASFICLRSGIVTAGSEPSSQRLSCDQCSTAMSYGSGASNTWSYSAYLDHKSTQTYAFIATTVGDRVYNAEAQCRKLRSLDQRCQRLEK